MKFEEMGLSDPLLSAIESAGYENPTPIQAEAIPHLLMGRDIIGIAQTGTGKTASFTLPMIEILSTGRARARMPRSLILEPTRELAAQVAENFEVYGKNHKLSMALLIGGVSFSDQEDKLDRGVDVLIATPGRLLDHFERGKVLLADIRVLVVDEADRMLDMGFIPDVERIIKLLPQIRQTAMFSATMPSEIKRLTDAYMMNPRTVQVDAQASAAQTVTQGLLRVSGGFKEKRAALRKLIRDSGVRNAIVFCNRKRDVATLEKSLRTHGFNAAGLHGDMHQSARMETLAKFRDGEIELLVASDVAARGLDIPNMSHVFNFDVPMHAEDYIHRIGRTGRAGKEGHAYTLATRDDVKFLGGVERLLGKPIPPISASGIPSAGETSADNRPAADQPDDQEQPKSQSVKGSETAEEKSEAPRRRRRSRRKAAPDAQSQGEDVPQEASEQLDAGDSPEASESPEASKSSEVSEPQEAREPRNARAPRKSREPRKAREPREVRQPVRSDTSRDAPARAPRIRDDDHDDASGPAFGNDETPAFLLR
ncbi:MAG: DEAD/DEAH box helicase [Proteobacteria bacterium]|nr:DEAD/DEAH box helicase [Pseudomonadota bacterium]